MKSQTNKDERIELRVSSSDKENIKRAQELSGDKSFSSFAVRILKKKAEEIISEKARIITSEKDRQVFFDAVFSNTKPNQTLVAAAKRYKSKKG